MGYEYANGTSFHIKKFDSVTNSSIDLSFWYGVGPGNPATSAQGIGYVQELIARLTLTPLTDFNSTVNSTIVSSNVTFPLSQPIFVDATHDTVIANSKPRPT